jgi:hypothetical protein
MRPRSHRRNLVVWSLPAKPAGNHGDGWLMRAPRSRRVRRSIRTGALLTLLGLMRLARGVRYRWRPLLCSGVLTVAGVMLRGGGGAMLVLPGLWALWYALLIPGGSAEDRRRHADLVRELSAYSTPAHRRDLEATLDRYPDEITCELRDILAHQAAACGGGIPGAGRR